MKKELTDKQNLAIINLKKAIKEVGRQGIHIFGMDQDILYVTEKAIQECKKEDPNVGFNYNPAADTYRIIQYDRADERRGTIVSGHPYVDSGGW